MGKTDEKVEDYKEGEKPLPSTFLPRNINVPKNTVQRQKSNRNIQNHGENRTLAIPGNNSGDFEELEKQLKSMMEKSQNKVADGSRFKARCKICGKEGFAKSIKDHIEANHIEGIIIPCNLCDKTFSTRASLRMHKHKVHTGKAQ